MIAAAIARAIELVDDEEIKTRELALVRTKLEEAELWLYRAQNAPNRQQRREAERQAAKAQASD